MRSLALLFIAFLTFASGCAGERPTLSESVAREVDPGADAAAEPVALRLAVPADWSIDPADAGPASLSTRVLADLLYEGLTRIGDDGQPEAALAERWFVSDDRLEWTFFLPPDLVDGAGEPITATDVKGSLERIAARGPADQAASALTAVTGWNDAMSGVTGGVAGIAVSDATVLVVQLDTPFELLPDVLASPAFGITGETSSGALRTTGAYAATEDPTVLIAIDPLASVQTIELVTDPAGAASAIADGLVDWAVLAADDDSSVVGADVVRQPLEVEVAIVARMSDRDERLGLLAALDPTTIAASAIGLSGRAAGGPESAGLAPSGVLVDIPAGPLAAVGEAIVDQLEDAGIDVLAVPSDDAAFAARLEAGDALVFPLIISGGMGTDSALLRLATPGAIDDVFGSESDDRSELAAAVRAETDIEQRRLFADALEQALIDDGYLLPVGRFEVRVALGSRLDGLRHRADGTLDLSEVTIAN